ncbi:hypothetical protein PILCRDRAFT_818108 [Piloderma croceum F 1598]|uniref:Ubiquitin-like protease family profile domain-containing protein n=1 Tax=Piloderma croceum (strain F 1598) TaxID=765440 RepID=A0A0C3FJC1_PILCF|nr:hypothetical protein PILCRDRAFT_818108 [Piloderma croceum F 1598]
MGIDLMNLAGETIVHLVKAIKRTEEAVVSPLPLQSPSTPPSSYEFEPPFHKEIPPESPKLASPPPLSRHSIPSKRTKEPVDLPLSSSTPPKPFTFDPPLCNPIPLQSPRPASLSPRSHQNLTVQIANAPSLPSTVTVTTSTSSVPSSLNFPSSNLEVDRALSRAERRVRRTGYSKKKTRPHIYAAKHKAQVQASKKKSLKEMERELYNLRRNGGYHSDFQTFKTLLGYRAKLELLEGRAAIIPSPSLTDLRSHSTAHAPRRRHSVSYDESFLERALAKAKKTLDGPKPPQPFIPKFDQLRISARAKDAEIEQRLRPKPKPLPTSLPPEDEAKVDMILRQRGVVSKHGREQVTDQDLKRLGPVQWVNDEIINFYGSMILARAEASKENPAPNGAAPGEGKPLNAHYFSTFFWSKLKGEGYEKARLAKWTKKFDLFSKDVVLIPVNHNNAHWTAAIINFRRKRIESYDSMGMDRGEVFKLLRIYLDAEHLNKKKKPFDFTGWEDYLLEDTPEQENGYDCGIFTCQFLERISRGEERFNFTQADMPYLRRLMIWEIGHAKLRG